MWTYLQVIPKLAREECFQTVNVLPYAIGSSPFLRI